MLNNILPELIFNAISNIPSNMLNEIRLRLNKPIQVCVTGKNYFLSHCGITNNISEACVCDAGLINYILKKVSNNALHTINDQIVNGYISCGNGIRIGVAGEIVSNNGVIKTIKNINSLNIRIPHLIKNCSLNAYSYLIENGKVLSTLILSDPGSGKTTFVKDLIYQIAKRNSNINMLVVDERGEINCINNSEICGVDYFINSSKKFAFENGIRSLNPQVIVTDEINLECDLDAITNALTCGVKVIATIHANNISDLKQKNGFVEIINKKMFDRFVVLNSSSGPGTLEGIYNQNLSCIYC